MTDRSFTVLDMPQRSPEWFNARAGRVTGSVAKDMLAPGRKKGEEGVSRRNLRVELALERITGVPCEDSYQSADMKRGIEMEADAVRAYEAAAGLVVRRTGFLQHATMPVGTSLDGHVGDFVGLVEVKCPKQATHWEYVCRGDIPAEYLAQCQHSMWLTGAEWVDFCSFDDRFPPPLRLFRVRLTREALDLHAYQRHLMQFLGEVAATEELIRAKARYVSTSEWQRAAEAVGAVA